MKRCVVIGVSSAAPLRHGKAAAGSQLTPYLTARRPPPLSESPWGGRGWLTSVGTRWRARRRDVSSSEAGISLRSGDSAAEKRWREAFRIFFMGW